MSIPGSTNLLLLNTADTGYNIERSLRFNSSDSAYLSRSLSSSPSSSFTFSMWVKRSAFTPGSTYQFFIGGYQSAGYVGIGFGDDDVLRWTDQTTTLVSSTAKFRDPSAWYHIVATRTSSARTIYVNGTQVATGDGGQAWSNGAAWTIGVISGFYYFSGYLADIHFIDGQALTPSDFTETDATTGQLIPKAYTGSFGTNGFWLKFSDNSAATATTLGKDYSGNSNNWTPNNLSVTAGSGNDSLVDTPTSYGTDTGAGGEVRGNYCTLNPLNASVTLSNGNLDFNGAVAAWRASAPTMFASTGKWYAEFTVASNSSAIHIGIANRNWSAAAGAYVGNDANSYGYRAGIDDTTKGYKWNNATFSAYGAYYIAGDVIGIALDLDAGTLTFYKNGASQGQAYSGISGEFGFAVSAWTASGSLNAGQRPFAYTAPSGFKALCDTNLSAPVVAQPNTVMDVKLYTGNHPTGQSITGLNFSPDLVWLKDRAGANWHYVFDSTRGIEKAVFTNATNAEGTYPNTLTAFNSNGFTLGSDNATNQNGNGYVAWTWDAGSSTVSNTDGSITSSVRANASAGFSIVTYTGNGTAGATIGHGLGVAPFMVIIKRRSAIDNWAVYHASLGGGNNVLFLESTDAKRSDLNMWNSTSPGSSSITLGNRDEVNNNGSTYVAYCFAPVAGYSSFGSYTGNGSADGPFVYTGFRPRWLMLKRSNNISDWYVLDTARDTYNYLDEYLLANSSAAEATAGASFGIDAVSNGFKVRSTGLGQNGNGDTIIYAAFAESPFQYARAR